MQKKIEIIYEDQYLVVCRKMPGIPVQTAKMGQQDMVSLLRNYYAAKGKDTQIFVVHRLDQPVEGIMVFARTKQAAADLSSQSRQRSMDKCYLALVEGRLKPSSGVLEDDLLREGKSNTSSVVPRGTPKAKQAKLLYKVQQVWQMETEQAHKKNESGQEEKFWQPKWKIDFICPDKIKDRTISLLEVKLETGRHHQIRVQMAHAGHPLVGDKKYNPNCPPGYLPVGLCSVKIAFCHPVTKKFLEFTLEPQGELFQYFSACARVV